MFVRVRFFMFIFLKVFNVLLIFYFPPYVFPSLRSFIQPIPNRLNPISSIPSIFKWLYLTIFFVCNV
ncbi:hypothetical protein Hanom_Chr11g01049701 [Helianthus anomalus]